MKLHLDISYEVEDDDPQVEEIGLQIVGDEAQAFGAAVRDRLSEAGVDIREFVVKAA
jgi:hypothetical protein